MRELFRGSIGSVLLVIAGTVVSAQAGAQSGADCDRGCLEAWVDTYLDAVIADDPSAVRFARNVRFTEDGQQLELGDGLWNTMKAKGSYRLFVTDVEAQQVAFIGTIDEDHRDPAQATPALLGLRLKIER